MFYYTITISFTGESGRHELYYIEHELLYLCDLTAQVSLHLMAEISASIPVIKNK